MVTKPIETTAPAAGLDSTARAEGDWLTAVRGALVLMLLCGGAYPLVAVWIGGAAFPHQATGSLIERDGVVVGSELVGQPFVGARWFHGRPSAAGTGYDPFTLSGSNWAPSNPALRERAQAATSAIAEANGVAPAAIPSELIAASGSGIDPHIGPAAALLQVPRVAAARGLREAQVRALVEAAVEGPTLGALGQPRVNVLRLNLALEGSALRAGGR
jgi:K+-transporting ATPase ATPase C chain